MAMAVPSRAASGPAAAIVRELGDTPGKLVLVDATGIVADVAVPDRLPSSLQWIDNTLVAWGGMGAGGRSD
jgi:hypothetical protein